MIYCYNLRDVCPLKCLVASIKESPSVEANDWESSFFCFFTSDGDKGVPDFFLGD